MVARTCSLGWALAAPEQGVRPVVVAVQRSPLPVKWAQVVPIVVPMVVPMVVQALPWQALGLLVEQQWLVEGPLGQMRQRWQVWRLHQAWALVPLHR